MSVKKKKNEQVEAEKRMHAEQQEIAAMLEQAGLKPEDVVLKNEWTLARAILYLYCEIEKLKRKNQS